MLTVRLLVYLIMALAFMVSSLVACHLIREDPENNRPWVIAAPALLQTVALNDLLS